MNAHDKTFVGGDDLAIIHYGAGELTVLRPGRFVLCAVTGKRLALDDLRYWSPALQEAYAGPAEALMRFNGI